MLTKNRRGLYAVLSALAIALTGTTLALAAPTPTPPTATTAPATNITATTATLNGIVDPNKTTITYLFKYGTTTNYGQKTPTQTASGNHAKTVSATVSGLKPATTYHFQIFAINSTATFVAKGGDMTFKTAPSGTGGGGKNAVSITSIPHTITWGRTATIAGSVTGPKKANDLVTLLYSPYPYTAAFKPTGETTTTSTAGAYTFTVRPGVNTRYKVLAATKVPVTSSATTVNVRVKVTIHVSTLHPFRGQRVRFFGTVTPVHNGRYARIQRRTSTGSWVTVTSTKLVAGGLVHGVLVSRYSSKITIRRSGTYRVWVNPRDGNHRTGTSAKRTELVH